jgi:peptidoglycan/LPS O-acetylase OafA/YrhL
MIAVVAVIFDHLVAWPSGGFVGVDVFFVISGFLITGILIREHEKTNRISFVGFYRRRLKRIVPAATLTLLVTVVAAFFIFSTSRYQQTFWDAVYAFFFSANWHFAAAGTDYFQAADPPSPLQHFWSLSVEEQFYFVWPWLMVGVLALAGLRRRFSQRRTVTGIVMVAIIVASFGWAMVDSTSDPTVAYFSTFTRAWELGVGALLAIATPWWGRIPDALRPVLGWLGLFGIVTSYFIINESLPFPAPWAALPVIATGLVIVGGTGGVQRFLWPLTNRVSVYIGTISYSLYLWHFPVIIIGAVVIGSNPWVYFPVTIVLIAAFSIASYYLVEEPILKSPWLDRARDSAKRRDWEAWRRRFANRLKYGWLGVLAAVSAGLVVMGFTINEHVDAPVTSFAQPTAVATDAPQQQAVATALSAERVAIEDALKAQEFPELTPAIPELGLSAWSDTMRATACLNVDSTNVDSCIFGPADSVKDVVLFGDSFAMAWLPAVRAAYEADGWRVHQLTRGECPSIDIEVFRGDKTPYPECARWRAWAMDTIDQIQPELTILANADTTIDRIASKSTGDTMRAEVKAGVASVIARVVPASDRTVVLGGPPRGVPFRTCAVTGAVPLDCATKPAQPWISFDSSQKAAAEEASVQFIETKDWFCGDNGWCPSFAANTPIRTDGTHLTIEYSTLLAPVLWEALSAPPADVEAVPADGTLAG